MSKNVIVTGGANGIGRAVALAFAREDYAVTIADVDSSGGARVADELNREEKRALFVRCDVSDPNAIKTLVEKSAGRFGGIDVVINNAGISEFIPPQELTFEKWDRILNTNLRASFLLTREAAPFLSKKERGAVINIASTRALMSEKNSEPYAASKGGLLALTHAMAMSFADEGIRINCISPGWIHTGDPDNLRKVDHDQHPSKRVGTPDDIARACLFLADDKNSFINGENLVIDGGMTRKLIYEH